jgi:molybdopterin-guanine dinucleotide biosynthesis protein A
MTATSAHWLVFMPVDLPLLPPALIKALLDHAEVAGQPVTLTSSAGFTQTFPAVLNRAVSPLLQSKLETGPYGCFSAFQAAAAASNERLSVLPAELLAQTGQVRHPEGLPPARWFSNLNSPDDLRRLKAGRPIRNAGPG